MALQLRFAKSVNGNILPGTRLEERDSDNLAAVLLDESEIGRVNGAEYLLTNKEALKPAGAMPHENGYEFMFEDPEYAITQQPDGSTTIIPRTDYLKKGMNVREGYILEVGEALIAIKPPFGNPRVLPKAMIHPKATRLGTTERQQAVQQIYKSIIAAEFDKELDEARKEMETDPTEAQKEAGNYKKGHINVHGLDVSIENPKGSFRRGKSREGKKWKTKMNNDYGYFNRTEDKDGDHVDVFIGPEILSRSVFVIDQVDPQSRKFDEHKVMLGFRTKDEAEKAYLSNYEKDWKGLGAINELGIDDFKEWLNSGETKKQISDETLKSLRCDRLQKSRVLTQEEASNLPDIFTKHFKVEGVNWHPQDAHEGDTRAFGQNDIRRLARTPSGNMRWMNADEYAKNQQRMQAMKKQQPAHNTPPPKKTQNPFAKIFTAINKGSAPPPTEQPQPEAASAVQPEPEEELGVAIHKAPGFKSGPPPTTNELFEATMREHRAKELADRSTKEYQNFYKEATADGFTQHSDFSWQAIQTVKIGDKDFNSEFRRVYDTDKKTWTALKDGKNIQIEIGGKLFEVIGFKDNVVQTRDLQSGEERLVHPFEFNPMKGSLAMDENGTLYIDRKGLGQERVIKAGDLDDAELLKPGLVGAVQGQIWKHIATGDGAVYQDVLIGRIGAKGVVDYKDENQMGIRDAEDKLTRVDRQSLGRDYPEEKMDEDLKKTQKKARQRKAKVKANTAHVTDVSMAKSSLEALTQQGPRENLSTFNYQETIDQYKGDTDEVIASLASNYGKPEWFASVDRLAQMMKAYDESKNAEIADQNSQQPEGAIKLIPRKVHSFDSYHDVAENALTAARSEFNKKRLAARIQSEREGTNKAKFDWDETSDTPYSPELASQKTMKIRDSRNNTYYAEYAFVPMQDVITSNDIKGNKNPDHPAELQARKRQEAGSIIQMERIAKNINDDVVLDSSDATRGAPVVFAKEGKYWAVAGNGRAAGISGTEDEQREKYFEMIKQKAQELGIDPNKLNKNFELVRVMAPAHTYEDARRLAAFGQKSSALPLTAVENAKSFQNAQREPFTFNVNLEGIGGRSIDENNVHTFIKNNPRLYDDIVKNSGLDRTSIESRPETQAEAVNTALLAQLKSNFIDQVAERDEPTHLLVRRIAPALALNQKEVQEGILPKWADMQNMVGDVMNLYDNLGAETKTLMNNRAGKIEFLSDDEHNGNPNTLLHRMSQEELKDSSGKLMGGTTGVWRNPLTMIGLVAYHQAANTRLGEKNRDAAGLAFALKVRRFQDALRQIGEGSKQEDMFGAITPKADQERERSRQILTAAEQTMLQNKPYGEENQPLTAEEQEVGNETYMANSLLKTMEKAKKIYGIQLTTDPEEGIAKSWFMKMFRPIVSREMEQDKAKMRAFIGRLMKSAEQMSIFPTSPEPSPEKEGNITAGIAWNIPGGEKPGHKWIKREKKKTQSEGYNYKYTEDQAKPVKTDEPSKKRTIKKPVKEFAKRVFNVGDRVANLGGTLLGKVKETGKDMIAVENHLGQTVAIRATEALPLADTESLREINADEIFGMPAREMDVPEQGTDRDFVSKELVQKGYYNIAKATIKGPEDLAVICRRLGDQSIERTFIFPVDENGKALGIVPHTIGTLNASLIDPRDLAYTLEAVDAAGYYLMHSHPSGNTTPSREDVRITKDIGRLAKKLGKTFHGHIVIGKDNYSIMTQEGDNPNNITTQVFSYKETKPKKRKFGVPIFAARKVFSDKGQPPEALSTAITAIGVLSKLSKDKPGVYIASLDTSGKVAGFHLLSQDPKEPIMPSSSVQIETKALRFAIRNGANSVIFYCRQLTEHIESTNWDKFKKRMENLLADADIATHDIIVDGGEHAYSVRSSGFVKSILGRTFRTLMRTRWGNKI